MIDLPLDIGPQSATVIPIDFGGFLEPALGAKKVRLNRMGNRTKLAVKLPPLDNARAGRIWASRLTRGMTEGIRWDYPLIDFDPGIPGEFVVDGGDQAGRLLAIRGGQAHYPFKEGQPFSLEIDGQHFLYFVDQQVIANASGDATIQISPMLRRQPADGDALHIAKPMIEGFSVGSPAQWELAATRLVGIEFEIEEIE